MVLDNPGPYLLGWGYLFIGEDHRGVTEPLQQNIAQGKGGGGGSGAHTSVNILGTDIIIKIGLGIGAG